MGNSVFAEPVPNRFRIGTEPVLLTGTNEPVPPPAIGGNRFGSAGKPFSFSLKEGSNRNGRTYSRGCGARW